MRSTKVVSSSIQSMLVRAMCMELFPTANGSRRSRTKSDRPPSKTLPLSWHHDTMPICIECSYPVSHLYSAYSRADDRSQGKGVRLTQCPRCLRFADKYVEYDFVVIFIDLVLIKPQASLLEQAAETPSLTNT